MAIIATKAPAEAYEDLKGQLRRAHSVATSAVSKLDATVDANAIVGFAYSLKQIDDDMAILAATPGIGAYAEGEEGSPTYDVVAEYNIASTAIGDVLTWTQTTFPVDGNDYLLGWKFGASGLDPRDFAPGTTAQLKTNCQAVVDAITV